MPAHRSAAAADTVTLTAARVPQGTCVARPQQTEGPYFVDEKLNRSDIRADPSDGSVKPGALLALTFNVSSLTGTRGPHSFQDPLDAVRVVGERVHLAAYFDDALTDRVHSNPPYAAKGARNIRNAADGIFRRNGSQLIVPVTPAADGYAGTFNIPLQKS